jgi:hypothetical protein
MPLFFIHAINSQFRSRDDGSDYDRAEDALIVGVRGAASLALDEIQQGRSNTAIEVRIEQEDGTTLLRSVVSLSVAPLSPAS